MGQSQRVDAAVVDTIITNALIVDHWGIIKADIGIKHGRIVGIGKGGNRMFSRASTSWWGRAPRSSRGRG